jgi:chromosome segregation ATPase
MENAVVKVNDLGLKKELEKLFTKVKHLTDKYNSYREDNGVLKEKIKDLEQAFSDIKIEISNKNSELLSKDRELTELKNKLLDEKKNKISGDEKTQLKSRIKDLIVRLDTHLEQKTNTNF